MSRFVNRTTQNVIDVTVLSLAVWLAFLLRFDWDPPFEMTKRHAFAWPYIVGFQAVILAAFGVPKFAWRYVGIREAVRILSAFAVATTGLVGMRIIAGQMLATFGYSKYVLVPTGVIAIDAVLAFLGIAGIRVFRRIIAEHVETSRRRKVQPHRLRTLLVGAGEAGVIVARELARRPDLGMHPVAFVDDNPSKTSLEVSGVPVVGTTERLRAIAEELDVEQVLITIANAPGRVIRDIAMRCRELGVPTKIIPGVYEIVGGSVSLTTIRDVAIDDLLGREPVVLDTEGIARIVGSRVVMVTGSGGSIGSELCRQIGRFGPSRLVLVERSENALFNIHRELVEAIPGLQVVPCMADVCDAKRMRALFAEHTPSVVFHAAAHKHVPMMEWNAGEAIKNNVFGTKIIADLADTHGVSQFVLISTDKAVNPTSVMGASKRLAEMYIQCKAQGSSTKFTAVRFGNVLGSAGSVIPIFKEQIARGGPVTVTHPEMKRYFMTIPEACQLVLQAASMGTGHEVFILDMGEPMRIIELARDLIRLSGFVPDEDIAIKFTGMRPGEKLFEDLSFDEEKADKTRHPKIFVGNMQLRDPAELIAKLEDMHNVVERNDPVAAIRQKLAECVPEYQHERRADPTDRLRLVHSAS